MGRNFLFLLIGVAVGVFGSSMTKQLIKKMKDEEPNAIQDKISDRLDLLEKQFTS